MRLEPLEELWMTTKERFDYWQPLVMHLNPVLELDENTFFHIAQLNKDLRLELTAERRPYRYAARRGKHKYSQFGAYVSL